MQDGRILGGDGSDKLVESSKLLKSPIDDNDILSYTPPSPTEPSTSPVSEEDTGEPIPAGSTTPEPTLPPSTVRPVTATPGEFTPIKGKHRIRIKIVRSRNPKPGKRRILINPDRAENLAVEFENEQARYPVKVSDIKGTQAYGCDILSFNNESDRINFMESPDMPIIARFIEVKGSGLLKGSIILKGNELKAAQDYPDRYYLYRVYEDEINRGTFELVELGDPLGLDQEALELQYEVHPFRTETAQVWIVTEQSEKE